MQDATINCTIAADLNEIKIEKTIVNCSLNLLSAIEKKTIAELFANKNTLARINAIFDESYAVLSHVYKIKDKAIVKKEFIKIFSKMVHYSSTYQDVMSGRRNEAEFLNGYIVELAKKNNLEATENKKIFDEFCEMYSLLK